MIVRPQPGPQEAFLSSPADIVIYGGAAGSGKSWAVLLEPLRHVTNTPDFSAVFFRRNTTHIRNPGGLWDESMKIYPAAGGKPLAHALEWRWNGGGRIKMGHLEYETTVLDWQGAQIPLIIFDELTHFTQAQFFYMMSRNRSMCGVRPYVRATTNPDADSWVASFIAWWIDQMTGYPIPERSGVIRWFIRQHDAIVWADTAEELLVAHGEDVLPKSVTFIPAKLEDNKALMAADPNYRANLQALSYVERMRLLGGNWKVRPAAGLYFRRNDVTIIDTLPTDVVKWVRRWDFAATEVAETNPDPDWTAGVLMGRRKNGRFVIADVVHERRRSSGVRELVHAAASRDGYRVEIGLAQDPGQAGKDQAAGYLNALAGYLVHIGRETGDKVTRADPFAAQWQGGNVDLVRGHWNEAFLSELEAFPSKGSHDDQVDAASGAFAMLARGTFDLSSLT